MSKDRDMDLALVMDIGGTHARLALARRESGRISLLGTRKMDTPPEGLAGVIKDFLGQELAAAGGNCVAVAAAVAGPIEGKGAEASVHMTNRNLSLTARELSASIGGAPAYLLNDLAAVAHALPELDSKSLKSIGGRSGETGGNNMIIGAGTGVGIAARLDEGGVLSGEGGHAMAALNDEIATRLRASGAVSIEQVLAGSRLPALFAAVSGKPAPASPEAVVELAKKADPDALATIRWYLQAFAKVCGDCTLLFGAWSGVYLSGAVLETLTQWLDEAEFRRGFAAKTQFAERLDRVRVSIITHPYPALLGLGRLALPES